MASIVQVFVHNVNFFILFLKYIYYTQRDFYCTALQRREIGVTKESWVYFVNCVSTTILQTMGLKSRHPYSGRVVSKNGKANSYCECNGQLDTKVFLHV